MTKKEIQQKYAAENAMFDIAPSDKQAYSNDLQAVFRGGLVLWGGAILYIFLMYLI